MQQEQVFFSKPEFLEPKKSHENQAKVSLRLVLKRLKNLNPYYSPTLSQKTRITIRKE